MSNVSWLLEVEIQAGASENFEELMQEMVASTQVNELGTIGYEWSTNVDGTICHLHERYKDSAAVMTHLVSFGEKFAERFMKVCAPTRLVVYGSPSEEAKSALAAFNPSYMASGGGFTR